MGNKLRDLILLIELTFLVVVIGLIVTFTLKSAYDRYFMPCDEYKVHWLYRLGNAPTRCL